MKAVKYLITLFFSFGVLSSVVAQKKKEKAETDSLLIANEQLQELKDQAESLSFFLEYVFNTMGDAETPQVEKDIILTETYSKYFRDAKVQVEDDLIPNREVVTNKDVTAYLQDIDFFFKNVQFEFTIDSIEYARTEEGKPYILVSIERLMTGESLKGEKISNTQSRHVEMNYDAFSKELKVVSIYTTKLSEDADLIQWWNSLPLAWRELYQEDLPLGDSIPSVDFEIVRSDQIILSGQTDTLQLGNGLVGYFNTFQDAKELDLSGKGIKDLAPISKMRFLQSLDISETNVTDISPLRSLTNLETFRCSKTLISDLSYLKYAFNLKTLDASSTMINSLEAVQAFGKLERLDVSGCNLLTDLSPLKELKMIKDLRFSGTPVNTLETVASLENLESIQFSRTPISDVSPLKMLASLEQVKMEYTKVSNIQPMETMPALRKIYCDHSPVTKEAVEAFNQKRPNVSVIYASDMLVNWWKGMPEHWKGIIQGDKKQEEGEDIREFLHKLLDKEEIDITNNQRVSNLRPIALLGNLKMLKCSGTAITSLGPIKELKDLRVLHFNKTKISSLLPLQGLTNLEEIGAEETAVTDVSALGELTALRSIKLNKSQVHNIVPLAKLPGLTTLEVDKTSVVTANVIEFYQTKPKQKCVVIYQTEKLSRWWYSMNFAWKTLIGEAAGLPAVTESLSAHDLHLVGAVEELKFTKKQSSFRPLAQMEMLRKLDISDLRMTSLPDLNLLTRLEVLDCSQNPVSNISAIGKMKNLRELNLGSTLTEDLGSIGALKKLEILNISGTNVGDLEAVGRLGNLRQLDCSNTRVKRLDPLFGLRRLQLLECYKTRISSRRLDDFKSKQRRVEVVYY